MQFASIWKKVRLTWWSQPSSTLLLTLWCSMPFSIAAICWSASRVWLRCWPLGWALLVRIVIGLLLWVVILWRPSSLGLWRLPCLTVHVIVPIILLCLHPSALLVVIPVIPLVVVALVVSVIVILLVVLVVIAYMLLLCLSCMSLVVVLLLLLLRVVVVLLLLVGHGDVGGLCDVQATGASSGEARGRVGQPLQMCTAGCNEKCIR
jgi:hypothetical protein